MKIVHVINSLGTGGAETLVVNLAIAQREAGHDVTIAVLNMRAGIPHERAIQHSIPITVLGKSRFDPLIWVRLRKLIGDHHLSHVHLFPALYWLALVAPKRHKWIYTEHSTHNRRRTSPLWKIAERWAYSKPARLIAISEGVSGLLSDHLDALNLRRSPLVVNNGIGIDFLNDPPVRGVPSAPIKLLAVGTLDSRKNFAEAIQITKILKNVTLTLIGEGPERGNLESKIKSFGLMDRVKIFPKSSKVREIMDNHDILLSTSRYEGFGLALVEGMARGLPVLAPDIEGIRGIVEGYPGGALYRRNKDFQISPKQVEELYSNILIHYQAYSLAAVTHSKNFSITNCSDQYLRIYTMVLPENT